MTISAGFVLRPRLPIYPEYINDTFVPASLMPCLENLAGGDGLVKPEIERKMLPRQSASDAVPC